MHPELILAHQYLYEPNNLTVSDIRQNTENKEYCACSFNLNKFMIHFRVAKITPKKIGLFVTFYKRIGNGPIMPYDVTDTFDFLIVSVRSNQRVGQFIFPKKTLHTKGYVTKEGRGGKRAMRVYPIWETPNSKQAQQTQAWQLLYFFELSTEKPTASDQVKRIFLTSS